MPAIIKVKGFIAI